MINVGPKFYTKCSHKAYKAYLKEKDASYHSQSILSSNDDVWLLLTVFWKLPSHNSPSLFLLISSRHCGLGDLFLGVFFKKYILKSPCSCKGHKVGVF